MASLLEVAKQINKKYKDGKVIITGDILPDVKKVPFGTLGADYATWGGIPYGAISVFAGDYGSGKTTAGALMMANYQKANPDKICVYVDVEGVLPLQLPYLTKMTGLLTDASHFVRYDCFGKSSKTIFEDLLDLQRGSDDIGMIIIDSVASLVSDNDMESDFSKDNGMRASTAGDSHKFCRMMIPELAKKGNPLLAINQVRLAGKTFTGAPIYTEPGGSAWNYYASFKVRFGTRTFVKDDKTDIAASKAEDTTGFRLKFSITKSRVCPINRGGGFITFDLEKGLDLINDTIEAAIKFNFIERPNNMTYIPVNLETGEFYVDEDGNELRFAGKGKLINYISSNESFRNEYFTMLLNHVNGSNPFGISLLDEDDLAEIMEEEASVEKASKKHKDTEDN